LRARYWSVLQPDLSFQARERDLLARIKEVYNREQFLVAKETDLEQRKRDVYEREQYVAANEWTRYIIFAPVRLSYRVRRWLYAHAPPWLVALKRRMFGVASVKPGTPAGDK
jgi:hypothetical protein